MPSVEFEAFTIGSCGEGADGEIESSTVADGMNAVDCCDVDAGKSEPPVAFCCQFSLGQGTRTPFS